MPCLTFDEGPTSEVHPFVWARPDEAYLQRLRQRLRLDEALSPGCDDYSKTRILCYFVHALWDHADGPETSHSDPIAILDDAQRGAAVHCVEYAIVLAGCLPRSVFQRESSA